MAFYLLTLDPSRITDRELMQIDIRYDAPFGDEAAFTVTVSGIDEFMTREDWDRVWERSIRPRQDLIWEERGMHPQGRRTVDIGRLRDAMPIYQQKVKKGLTEKDLFSGPSADWPEATQNWDQETIRRVMRDLNRLLKPPP